MAKASRLGSVMRVRKIQEDLARQALAIANRNLISAEGERNRRSDHYNSISVPVGMRTREQFLREEQTMRLAAGSVGFATKLVSEATGLAASRRESYIIARRNLKIIEKLQDRKRAEQSLAEDRAEVKAIDDIVTTRWAGEMAGANRP
ncbi:MAG TPA: flagellar FliJ family protein [Acidimicrobiales bacterium]|nr:flagellar FliJ family protein [Acidimicrobiales bacterium]